MSLSSPTPTLTALTSHLTRLRDVLGPVLSQPLSGLLHSLESGSSQPPLAPGGNKAEREAREEKRQLDGRLDSAKLQAAAAYTICALVWVYLKSKGLDPRSHPVHAETERVLAYLRRIKSLDDPPSSSATKSTNDVQASMVGKRTAVDQDAASRFIRAALQGEGKHTRFEGEEDGKAKGKGKEVEEEDQEAPAEVKPEGGKKKRKAMDPFEGYSNASSQPKAKAQKAKKDSSPSPASSPASKGATGEGKRKKAVKKAKK